jgi:hypothetical protein
MTPKPLSAGARPSTRPTACRSPMSSSSGVCSSAVHVVGEAAVGAGLGVALLLLDRERHEDLPCMHGAQARMWAAAAATHALRARPARLWPCARGAARSTKEVAPPSADRRLVHSCLAIFGSRAGRPALAAPPPRPRPASALVCEPVGWTDSSRGRWHKRQLARPSGHVHHQAPLPAVAPASSTVPSAIAAYHSL